MASLLDQLRRDLPSLAHRRCVYYSADPVETERLVKRASELNLVTVRFLLALERFEARPDETSRYRAAYDALIAALHQVLPVLATMEPLERNYEKSED